MWRLRRILYRFAYIFALWRPIIRPFGAPVAVAARVSEVVSRRERVCPTGADVVMACRDVFVVIFFVQEIVD